MSNLPGRVQAFFNYQITKLPNYQIVFALSS